MKPTPSGLRRDRMMHCHRMGHPTQASADDHVAVRDWRLMLVLYLNNRGGRLQIATSPVTYQGECVYCGSSVLTCDDPDCCRRLRGRHSLQLRHIPRVWRWEQRAADRGIDRPSRAADREVETASWGDDRLIRLDAGYRRKGWQGTADRDAHRRHGDGGDRGKSVHLSSVATD